MGWPNGGGLTEGQTGPDGVPDGWPDGGGQTEGQTGPDGMPDEGQTGCPTGAMSSATSFLNAMSSI
jgi:hypothetical protein